MFAVPGWTSVSATSLRTQTEAHIPRDQPGEGGSRKRKRKSKGSGGSGDGQPLKVKGSGANNVPVGISARSEQRKAAVVADERPVTGPETIAAEANQGAEKLSRKARKKAKLASDSPATGGEGSGPTGSSAQGSEVKAAPATAKATTAAKQSHSQALAVAAKEPKLTPLQQKMRDKLTSARFRHLNETLYTTASPASVALFDANPSMFTDYHAGFRQQVITWPENPVETFINLVNERAKVRPGYGKHKNIGDGEGLPRARDGWCTIIDLGCGDAALAAAVDGAGNAGAKRKLRVRSYDLAAPNERVIKADIRSLPLGEGSVDVAVFCLALMGTNWIEFVEEAYRVLRWKGELWVAEIKSRFARRGEKKGAVVEHSVGKRRKVGGKESSKKAQAAEEEVENEEELRTEVDGSEKKEETDVAAFVEVLQRRGFVLKDGQRSVDLSNKMFVRMEFVKAAPALVGKNVREEQKVKRMGEKKFVDAAGEVSVEDEAKTLKPCLYKIR